MRILQQRYGLTRREAAHAASDQVDAMRQATQVKDPEQVAFAW
jgi:hypothetical protein